MNNKRSTTKTGGNKQSCEIK